MPEKFSKELQKDLPKHFRHDVMIELHKNINKIAEDFFYFYFFV